MDDLLARMFRERGGELRAGARWHREKVGEGIVDASGRRVQPAKSGFQWLGLKAHAENVSLDADLEMHGSQNQYVGVSRLPGGKVNVCGLFRRRAEERSPIHWQEVLRGASGSPLRNRLEKAVFDEDSFCSVAGFSLEPRRASATTGCSLGDALTMIPPVTGNGMSMALESAALAIEPLTAYSRGELRWDAAKAVIAEACDTTFARRLRWARWLQQLMFLLPLSGHAGNTLLRWEWFWNFMFKRTR
jgi:2-polyprenyl-6-methoxyphenol hydroxylase-like FAD-dependent oxidoreductase